MTLRSLGPAFLWAVVILLLSAFPGDRLPDEGWLNIPHLDKLAHLIMYMILAFFLGVGFKKEGGTTIFQRSTRLMSFVLAGIYGVLMEFLQFGLSVGRSFEYGDMIANCGGAALGILLFHGIYGKDGRTE